MPISGGLKFLDPQLIISQAGITEGMKVADLGCGNLGYLVIPLAKIVGETGMVYGVDIQKTVLEGVRTKAKLQAIGNLELIWADIEKVGSIKITPASCDAAILVNILFQNNDQLSMLKEATRILKQGGRLIVVDWKKIGIAFGPPVEKRLDPLVIKNYANQLNLTLAEEFEPGNYFWGMKFTKN